MMDMAYVTDHLLQGRLRELGATVDLAEDYYVAQRPNPRNDRFVGAFLEWLLKEARSIGSQNFDLSSE